MTPVDVRQHHARGHEPDGARSDVLDPLRRMRNAVRRAFREFLALPTAIITAFLVLAVVLDAADRATPGWVQPARQFLQQHVFIDASTTSDVLSAIAAGIITVTSITVSVLLLAVQQSAASMSTAVFDQFLRRRENQLSFGYFIGLGLYTLVTLATVHQHANAVLGASMGVLLTVAALYVLLVLLYSTVDQMRPSVVLGSIARLTLQARRAQRPLVARTRRRPTPGLPLLGRVTATDSGHVTRVDLRAIERALEREGGDIEIVLLVAIGSFAAHGDPLAELRGRVAPARDGSRDGERLERLGDVVRGALQLEVDRDIGGDPGFGIEQIQTIGWTSISSAKSNPSPGLLAIRTVRDLLARWAEAGDPTPAGGPRSSEPPRAAGDDEDRPLPVVYVDDVIARAFDALESMGVAASESKQHQSIAEVLRAVASLVERLPADQRRRSVEVVERMLPTLESHVRTRPLDDALAATAEYLDAAGEHRAAAKVRAARDAREERDAESERPRLSARS